MPPTNMAPSIGKRKRRQQAFDQLYNFGSADNPSQPRMVAPELGSDTGSAPPSTPPIPPPLPADVPITPLTPTISEMEDNRELISCRLQPRHRPDGAPAPKRKRGLVKDLKAYRYWKRHNKKVKIIMDEAFLHGPHTRGLNSWLTHDIGHILRDIIPMMACTWGDLDVKVRKKLVDELKLVYDIDWGNKAMCKWVDKHAATTYKRWKSQLNQFTKMNPPNEIPKEFQSRREEWNWLLQHFQNPKFVKQSIANTTNRKKKTLHHRTGSTPFIYGAHELKEKGEQMLLIKNYENVYPPNHPEAARNIAKIREEVDRVITEANDTYPDIPEAEIIHIFDEPTQVQMLVNALGHRNNGEVRGLGGVTFGVTASLSQSSTTRCRSSQVAEETVRDTLSRVAQMEEEAREAKERIARAEQEAREAKERLTKAEEEARHVKEHIAQMEVENRERFKRLEEMVFRSSSSQSTPSQAPSHPAI